MNTNFDPNPQASEVVRQEVVIVNGVQKVVEKTEYLNLSPLKNSPQHDTFKYHPLQEPETYICAASGYEILCKGERCRAHVITQKVKPLKNTAKNILIICKAHEKHFNDKPLKEWYVWVKKNYPEHFEAIEGTAKFINEQIHAYIEVMNVSV